MRNKGVLPLVIPSERSLLISTVTGEFPKPSVPIRNLSFSLINLTALLSAIDMDQVHCSKRTLSGKPSGLI